ncbi:hypothetical protein BH23ACT12_BH23ACT12_13850 [soil metagenome]
MRFLVRKSQRYLCAIIGALLVPVTTGGSPSGLPVEQV